MIPIKEFTKDYKIKIIELKTHDVVKVNTKSDSIKPQI